ncbi:MAG: SRPBCC family protein [Acidimicrobiia bacterium]|nr:SRPBCC family protein [Acidimicrobiia bacterium]MBT8215572.1 SRPBCC family protein [Acidimicrobiia bacterium]NNL68994.1 cyclase [Acidimicrobiia bacterium]
MAEGTVQTIEVSAPAEIVFDVAAHVENFPEWATGVRETEVLEVNEDGTPARARLVVDGMIRTITYVLNYTYDGIAKIEWTAEPGDDIATMEGRYEFYDLEDGGTEVVYALRVEPNFKVPGMLRRQAEKQIVGTALRGLRDRAEELASAAD